MKKIKTLSDIEALEKEMLIPADIAPILGCHPYTINIATETPSIIPSVGKSFEYFLLCSSFSSSALQKMCS